MKRKAIKRLLPSTEARNIMPYYGVRFTESEEGEDKLPEAISLNDQAYQVRSAFERSFTDGEFWPIEVFEGFITVQKEGKLFRAEFTRTEDSIVFGELVEVEQEFIPVRSVESEETNDLPTGVIDFREQLIEDEDDFDIFIHGELHEAEDAPNKGSAWDVTVIKSGHTVKCKFTNGSEWVRNYPLPVLTEAVPLFENASVFAFSGQEHAPNPSAKGVRDEVGYLENVHMSGTEMRATLIVYDDAEWLQQRLNGLDRADRLSKVGLSIDAGGKGEWSKESSTLAVFDVEKIGEVSSVDVVHKPAAGGGFNRLVASQEEVMNRAQMIALLKKLHPELLESVDVDNISDDDLSQLVETAMTPAEPTPNPEPETPVQESVTPPTPEPTPEPNGAEVNFREAMEAMQTQNTELANQFRLSECRNTLNQELRESKLPEPVQKKLRKQFEGKVFETSELLEAITLERDTLAQVFSLPRAHGGVSVAKDERDKKEQMLEAMIWGSQAKSSSIYPSELKDVAPFRSIKEAYREITGDYQATDERIFFESQFAAPPERIGSDAGLRESWQRQVESLTSSDFGQILGDSVRRRMIAEYNLPALQDWRKIVSDVSNVPDFRTNRRMRMGGYGALPTVAESGTYQPLTSPTDEEETFSVAKKGGLEDLTFEMIKNDDVGALRRIPQKLARSAGQTLYRAVFDMLEDNGTMADSIAVVDASHNNLISGAMTDATLSEGRRLMMDQAAYNNSTELLQNPPKYLVHPTELWDEATRFTHPGTYMETGQGEVGTTDRDMNLHNKYGLEPIEVNYFAVATDFWLIGDPNNVPTIEVAFLDGREEPELFVQDQPTNGSAFSSDKVTYKIRHIYGTVVLDYRGIAAYIA